MKHSAKEVGLFDAKTHLSELVERVRRGEEITILKRGAAVARLVPVQARPRRSPSEAANGIRALSKGLALKDHSIRALIEEGRL